MAPLGDTIKRAREKRGWSRMELARQSGVPQTTIRNIENADHDVRTDERHLQAMADALGNVSFDELRVLAGYLVTKSTDLEAANRRLFALINAYPHLRRSLERLAKAGNRDEIDEAASVLEVHLEVLRRRRQLPK